MDAAQVYYDESLELVRASGDLAAIANALYNDSFPANVTTKDVAKARALLEEALPIYQELNNEPGISQCLWALGQAYYQINEIELAKEVTEGAIAIFRRLGNQFGLGWALFTRAVLALQLHDTPLARRSSFEALRIFARADDVTGKVLVLDCIAEITRRDGDALRAARLAGASEAHEVTTGAGL